MSHFTHMKTSFQNLTYLEKALNRLTIPYQEQQNQMGAWNLVISQSNGYNIEFHWNGEEYELVADRSFWEQPYPMETFIDKIAQKYASENIIGESQKTGFQLIQNEPNVDGSNTLVLERWNNQGG